VVVARVLEVMIVKAQVVTVYKKEIINSMNNMKKVLVVITLGLFVTGCNKIDKVKTEPSSNPAANGQVYESTSETSVTTAVEAELDIINQGGTSDGSGL